MGPGIRYYCLLSMGQLDAIVGSLHEPRSVEQHDAKDEKSVRGL